MFQKLVNAVKSDLSHVSLGKFCPVRVNGTYTKALIDSGNTAGNCISYKFAQKIGLDKSDIVQKGQTLGTAKKGAKLTVYGVPKKPLILKFGGLNTEFKTKPYVIEELSSDLNISLNFLEKHKFDQIHSKHCLKINGKLVRLHDSRGILSCNEIDEKRVAKKMTTECYIEKDVEVPPNSIKFVKIRVPQIQRGFMENGTGILEPSDLFIKRNDVHPCKEAAVNIKKNGTAYTSVLNTLDIPVKIKKDQQFGNFTKYTWRESKKKYSRLTWTDEKIIEEFGLDSAPALKSKADKRKAINFIKNYGGLFAEHEGDFGETDLIEHEIDTGDNKPVKQKQRPMNPPQADDFRKQWKIWMDADIIEEASSPWNSRLLAVPKKNGKTRYVVDYRMVNAATKKDSYPLPNIDESLSRMGHAKVFSTMDGAGAYHVVRVKPEDREKTAFSCEFGQYQFKRLPFGLCNAPSTYARLLQRVLQGLDRRYVANYLDDTCVFTPTLDDHFLQMKKVFDAHRDAGIKLSPKKCRFFQEETEFLGHVISKDGIKTNPKNTDVIINWRIENLEDVHTFVGKCIYYSNFIQDFASRIAPLQNLLNKENLKNKKKPVLLTREELAAVHDMKTALTEPPVLAYPDFESKEPFILDTDWSHDPGAIGGVLSQKQNGQERVIAFGARKLKAAEKNYSANKGEMLAVIHFMEKWKFYLCPKPFILRTDHQALRWLLSMEAPSTMTCRWLQMMVDRNFEIQFRPGERHKNADSLSRARIVEEVEEVNDMLTEQRLQDVEKGINQIQTRSQENRMINSGKFEEAMEKDSILQEVNKWFDGELPQRKKYRSKGSDILYYYDLFKCLLRRGDRIYLKWKSDSGATIERLCVPRDLQQDIIKEIHNMGHSGMNNTVEKVKRRYAFPGISKKVENVVNACLDCTKRMDKKTAQKNTLISTTDGAPFQRLSVDIVVMKESSKKNKYLLTAKCCFTKWLEAIPMPDQTAETVGKTLFNHVFSRHGMPQQCHSDLGRQFIDKTFQSMCQQFGILKTATPAYNPKSNPVERSHRQIKACLKTMSDLPGDWEDHLPAALLCIRTTVNRSTKMTPFMALHGREANLPIEIAYGIPPGEEETMSIQDWADQLSERLRKIYENMRKNNDQAIKRSAAYYTQGSIRQFSAGDKVWLFTPRIDKEKGAKLTNPWSGPWLVQQKLSKVIYRIITLGNWNRHGIIASLVSIDRLTKYNLDNEHENNDDLSAEDITLPMTENLEDHLEEGETIMAPTKNSTLDSTTTPAQQTTTTERPKPREDETHLTVTTEEFQQFIPDSRRPSQITSVGTRRPSMAPSTRSSGTNKSSMSRPLPLRSGLVRKTLDKALSRNKTTKTKKPELPPRNIQKDTKQTTENMDQTEPIYATVHEPMEQQQTSEQNKGETRGAWGKAKSIYGKIIRKEGPYEARKKSVERMKKEHARLLEKKMQMEENRAKELEKMKEKAMREEEIRIEEELRKREKQKRQEEKELYEELKRRQEEETRQYQKMIKKKQLEEECKLRFEMREKAEKRILEAASSEEEAHRAKQQRNLQRATDFASIKYLTDKQRRGGKTHYSDNENEQRKNVVKYSSEPVYAGSTAKTASVTEKTQKKQRTLLQFLNTDSGTTETEEQTSDSAPNSLPSYHSSQQELPIFAPARRTIALAHPQASDSSDTDRSRSTLGRRRTDDSSTEEERRVPRSRRDQDKIFQQLSQ